MKMRSLKLLPICTQQPKTVSFRVTSKTEDNMYKTINSVYHHFDPEAEYLVETPESWFTNSFESASTDDYDVGGSSSSESHLEELIRGAQQQHQYHHRLFFEPGGDTSSIINISSSSPERRTQKINDDHHQRGVRMAIMDSRDPYGDFRKSMEEMVESLGVTSDDWESLEELLGCYLKANGKSNHGYIVHAFVDLIAAHDDDDIVNMSTTTSFSTAASSLSSTASTSAAQLLEDHSSLSHHTITSLLF